MKQVKSFDDLEKLRREIVNPKDLKKSCVIVSSGTCGRANRSEQIAASVREEIKKQGLENEVDVRVTGCLGFCEREPILIVDPQRIFYPSVKPESVSEIIRKTVINGEILEDLLYVDPVSGDRITYEHEIPFYKKQERIVFGNNSKIDPTSIRDYIAIDGYSALAKVLSSMTPDEVIDTIKSSGLRGRGGGGFPTGVKWESCRKAEGDIKYVLCNADEGDPGAYMDRSVLEGNPHSVLEGMIIGAYAIGAHEGYVYVRQEYPLAVELFEIAVNQALEYGLLGKDILGSGFDFTVHINRGGGAFVCGESTALMASIEGRPGEPRAKHIHTVEKGLWDKPSNLNNVETWANVPLIINKGAEWYSKLGTEKSKGTKIFSLVGKVNNTGLVEVPMGITLREIIYDIGGGIKEGRRFKAVQTGGPSGGCIPESLIDLPVDYERLTEAGSMMGSGGMIVMDERNCMVDIARYFVNFLKDESCGKCTPCRQGLIQMHQILTDICRGEGTEEDLSLLDELCWIISETSLCQLGATAPNPVLTTLKYFRDEYEAHVIDRKCPGGVCKQLIHYVVDEERCVSLGHGCGACRRSCPQQAISGEKNKPHRIDQSKCSKCGICFDTCKFEAIILK